MARKPNKKSMECMASAKTKKSTGADTGKAPKEAITRKGCTPKKSEDKVSKTPEKQASAVKKRGRNEELDTGATSPVERGGTAEHVECAGGPSQNPSQANQDKSFDGDGFAGEAAGVQMRSRSRSRNKSSDSDQRRDRSSSRGSISSHGSTVQDKSPEASLDHEVSLREDESGNKSNSAQPASSDSSSSSEEENDTSETSSSTSGSSFPVRQRRKQGKHKHTRRDQKRKRHKQSSRRRLNYDCRSGEFTPSEQSPAMTATGDHRHLQELQQYLDDPKKVESALELLRQLHGNSAKKHKHSDSSRERDVDPVERSRSRRQSGSDRARRRSPSPWGEPIMGDSETTVYTRGIKSTQQQSLDEQHVLESVENQNSDESGNADLIGLTDEIESLNVTGR